MGMSSVARGKLAGILALVLLAGLLLDTACMGTKGSGSIPTATIPGTVPATGNPSSAIPRATVPDLSSPPPKASPIPVSSVDPLVGKWSAPPPDDLTFEFFPDGTFTEQSPNFRPYHGTWGISEEREADFYDATILDQWGYKKQAHLLITTGSLYIKSVGTLHRVG